MNKKRKKPRVTTNCIIMPTANLFTLAVILALKSVDSEHENSQKKRKIFAKILEDITTHQQEGEMRKKIQEVFGQ